MIARIATRLLLAWVLSASFAAVAAEDEPQTESPAQCVARTKDTPVDCFVLQARFELMHCQLKTKLALMKDEAAYGICRQPKGKFSINDHYQATLRQFAKKRDAQARTKDLYALWRSAISGMAPNPGEIKMVYESRVNRLSADFDTAAERLLLEK